MGRRDMTLELKGFDEVLEKLQQAGKSIDVEGRKCFETAAENLYDSLYEQAGKAGLAQHLREEIDEEFVEIQGSNAWHYEVGWKKQRSSKTNPIPDVYKVMFYNYGTPSARHTRQGGQRVMIDGQWVTLTDNRGQEQPHPSGSHGFIKKAKLSAAAKNRKLYKSFLEKVLGDFGE